MTNNTLIRTLHDIGIASWFGGSLMGAVGLNGGAASAKDRKERTQIASAGWGKWAPVNAVGIAAHVVGGTGLLLVNKGRLGAQSGVGGASLIKTALTAGAIGATACSGVLGKRIADRAADPSSGVTEPAFDTSNELAEVQRQQKIMQWVIPVLTGSVIFMSAKMGEQQRASNVVSGIESRLRKRVS